MFRAVCFYIFLLNSFSYNGKYNSVCFVECYETMKVVNSVIKTVQRAVKMFNELTSYFYKTYMENDRINRTRQFWQRSHNLVYKRLIQENMVFKNYESPMEHNAMTRSQKQINDTGYMLLFGRKIEIHSIVTADKYLLTVHRIVPDSREIPNQAIILHHGLLGSSDDWLLLGPDLALPYMLADKGYDVWLLNARGNKYSTEHTIYHPDTYEFWEFSWHEMGVYDLPAAITYITACTRSAELYFIGHSMGATALLVLLSSEPSYNDVLKAAFLLAPLAFMYHSKGPLRELAENKEEMGLSALRFLGRNEFLPSGQFPQQLISKYCNGDEYTCTNPLLLMESGGKLVDITLMKTILRHVPSGGSAMTVMHYLQLIKTGLFMRYDYGLQGNFRKYEQTSPPEYNLDAITLPISVLSSPSDWLSTRFDVDTLIFKLKNVYFHQSISRQNFSHMDFIWAMDAPRLVYNVILEILRRSSVQKQKLAIDYS